ncbi:segregation/condensation protein A [Gluconacetobacter sp. 1c LMG 22058]|uniref:Segregation and condensation protein A n=1 Tax=Gluconacetobacter dulcium TaxID=2729096 RepID=A0A7W4K2D7_9PROT|nr:segregation/condensation protein A [Gluconacetobacter dulcium]MBB2199129.1 segregation/condensation protein A [Gluconacetobacter dulcium]
MMAAEVDPAWKAPSRVVGIPELHLAGYDGPLDLLLDLAERQRIDLGAMSVADLAEQFVAGLAAAQESVPLERRADWLTWAARLVLLRSRLIFGLAEEREEAERESRRTAAHLEELLRMRAAADWLARRPQLGHDVFDCATGVALPAAGSRPAANYFELMAACLTVLEHGLSETPPIALRLQSLGLWTMSDAMAQIRDVLASCIVTEGWSQFLPPLRDGPDLALRRRAALAGAFVAALELARIGELDLDRVGAVSVSEQTGVASLPEGGGGGVHGV